MGPRRPRGGQVLQCRVRRRRPPLLSLSLCHSGFTGTLAWADPENDLIYIFLSNRIHPDENNKKLLEMDVRTEVMQVIYDSLDEK